MTRHMQVSAGGVGGLGYHVVGCPRYRRPVLAGRVAGRCEELIRAEASGPGWRMVAPGIMPGHVRLFVEAHGFGSPSRVTRQFKGFTSRCLRAGFAHLRSRLPVLWSRSYFAAAVGAASAEWVRRYIGRQDGRRWREEQAR